MNIKKILVLLLFVIAIIGIITPVEAKLNLYGRVTSKYNGETKVHFYVDSNKNSVSAGKAELSKVNKVAVTVKGYKTITFKKLPKSWKDYYPMISPIGSKKFKGTFLSKKITSFKLYDKKGKLLRSGKSLIEASEEVGLNHD